MKVLVVEKQQESGQQAAALLTEAGYEVVVADDCDSGLSLVTAARFDLLLTDLCNGDDQSIEYLSELRKLPGQLLTPIIVMTPDLRTRERGALIAAGVAGIIEKPFQQERLLALVGSLAPI